MFEKEKTIFCVIVERDSADNTRKAVNPKITSNDILRWVARIPLSNRLD